MQDDDPGELVVTPPWEPPSEQEARAEIEQIEHPGSTGLFRVFRHRNYRLFFAGQLVTFAGTFVQVVAQGWLVYALTRSAWLLGVTSFAGLVPGFFLSPFAGTLSDRVDRRKLLMATRGLAMLQAFTLAVLTLTHAVHVWHVIVLALLLGIVNAFDVPTRQAFTLDMVEREDLRSAISLNSMMFNLARILGPTIGGFFVAMFGEGLCFAINGICITAVLSSYFRMRIPPKPQRHKEHPWTELKQGFAYAWNTRLIRVSLILVTVTSCFGAAYLTLMPAIARDVLHAGSQGLGMLMGSVGLGALIGAYVLAQIPERWLTLTPPISAAAFGLSLILFAQSHLLVLSMVLLLPVSFFLMLVGGATNTIIQTVAEEHLRGRIVSLYTMSFMGMMPWGSLILGWLGSHFGVAEAVLIGGGICMLGAVVSFFDRARHHGLEGAAPAE
ncbi:MAG: MFS transporter [Alphaproteobacteria bacterium]|nr:MFS transporter [Alphaproteobacteria bacterium]MBL6936772.1 MFS transporter [Alphaproteobacteria bacterium]MBL7097541.1 MFS transporter [Alphaproteobacteria bacterium]